MTTADAKLTELAVYVAERCSAHELFGKVKLNKILFHADMYAFLETGSTLTGATYIKKQFGPVPDNIDPLLADLEREGRIAIEPRMMGDGKVQYRVRALRGPDLSGFSYEQLAFVERALDRVREMSANEVSEATHLMPGWSAARMGEPIPMEAALVQRARPLTGSEMARVLEFAGQHQLLQ